MRRDESSELTADSFPQDRAQRQWVARGLGRPVAELSRLLADEDAGEDAGNFFYTTTLSGVTLAIRTDALRAYIIEFATKIPHRDQLAKLLEEWGLADVDVPLIRITKPVPGDAPGQKWIKVSEGRLPQHPDSFQIEYAYPGREEEILPARNLLQISQETSSLLQSEKFEATLVPGVQALTAIPGDVLARLLPQKGRPGRDVFGQEIPIPAKAESHPEAGPHVTVSSDRLYRAERYGYVCLQEDRLSIVPPLWIDPTQTRVYLVVLSDEARPVTAEMIHQWLEDLGVVAEIRKDEIDRAVTALACDRHGRGLSLIAEGREPQGGKSARLEIVAGTAGHSGQVLEEGLLIEVQANQLVAQRILPTADTLGQNVKGDIVPAPGGEEQRVWIGANLWTELREGVEQFFAGENGVLKIKADQLSVVELLKLKGDINFKTGNLNFRGEVFVEGSVRSGFSVEADEGITVTSSVDSGALVTAEEDIVIKEGVIGQRTRVIAGGYVRASFIRDARIVAGKDIALENYAHHAELHAGGKVVVSRDASGANGQLAGGHVWAHGGIDVHIAGSAAGVPTTLIAGLAPKQARELARLDRGIKRIYEHILHILQHFYLQRIDVMQIRNMIAATKGPRRQLMAGYARKLGELVQTYQELLAEQERLRQTISVAVQGVEIRVRNMAFPGVIIRIGDKEHTITEEIRNICFYLKDGELSNKRSA